MPEQFKRLRSGGSGVGNPGVAVLGALALAVCSACGETPTAPMTATVTFAYATSAPTRRAGDAASSACIRSVLRTHLSVSWKVPRYSMTERGQGRYELAVSGAPVGRDLTVSVADPNACFRHPSGRATSGITANGVRLTRLTLDGPAGPRFHFRVESDGTVVP